MTTRSITAEELVEFEAGYAAGLDPQSAAPPPEAHKMRKRGWHAGRDDLALRMQDERFMQKSVELTEAARAMA